MHTNPQTSANHEHDRLFKELLRTFFIEFIHLFFPKLAEHLDPEVAIVPLSQEIYDDIGSGDRHVIATSPPRPSRSGREKRNPLTVCIRGL